MAKRISKLSNRKRYLTKLYLTCFLTCMILVAASSARSVTLSIYPVFQKTPVWCWVAVGEMTFTYYDVPNVNPGGIYQCGVIGVLAGVGTPCNRDCRLCTVPAGSLVNIASMLRDYSKVVHANKRSSPEITGMPVYRSLSKSELKSEIDDERPVIAGITPSGFQYGSEPMHVALIIGYDEESNGRLTLTVNDPFPYDAVMFRAQNPFVRAGGKTVAAGQYEIDYDSFKSRLQWGSTIHKIKKTGSSSSRGGGDFDERMEDCMSERPNACISVCMESYGHSYSVCKLQMCRPDDPRNIRSWRSLCERRIRRERSSLNTTFDLWTTLASFPNGGINSFL
jgi:hypothetical protein